jgi:hypothetical protein
LFGQTSVNPALLERMIDQGLFTSPGELFLKCICKMKENWMELFQKIEIEVDHCKFFSAGLQTDPELQRKDRIKNMREKMKNSKFSNNNLSMEFSDITSPTSGYSDVFKNNSDGKGYFKVLMSHNAKIFKAIKSYHTEIRLKKQAIA